VRRRRDDRIQLSLVGRESSLAPAAPDAVLNRSRHSSLQRSLSGSIRRFGQHLIQRQRKPDSRPTKLECDIPHRLFRVRGRKRIYALIAGSRKRSIGVVSSKCEGLHGPIRRCPTRPLLPLQFRDLPDQGGRNRIGRERGFELAQIRWLLSKPDRPSFRPQRLLGCRVRQAAGDRPATSTGILLCSYAHNSFGLVVIIAKLRSHSPLGERQFSHNPANAIKPRSAKATV